MGRSQFVNLTNHQNTYKSILKRINTRIGQMLALTDRTKLPSSFSYLAIWNLHHSKIKPSSPLSFKCFQSPVGNLQCKSNGQVQNQREYRQLFGFQSLWNLLTTKLTSLNQEKWNNVAVRGTSGPNWEPGGQDNKQTGISRLLWQKSFNLQVW